MNDNTIFDNVNEIDLKNTMEKSYIDYAMSVIVSRALPDVRDGLKPVQRRILYSMIELNNGPDKPHRKCARIVGDTMGKYHPHGDSSIYGALVNLAQEWSTRYPLVDGHGNFGSVDGDGAAAMRYTEARLSRISMEMTADINKDTVDFVPNFDETEREPSILPSRYPNLMVNGAQGIAVGMATNIPPHNLRETIDGVVTIIDNQIEEDRETSIDELLPVIQGPDFPTGAMILGRSEIERAYRTGRGKIKVRAVTAIEPMKNGKQRIIVTELPYMVNKARLIEKIASLVRDKRIEGITDLRDESDRQGMRICIELRKDVNPNVILNQLFKHTQMQDTFGVIMLALVDNQPKIMNLKEILTYYLDHQKEVVTRRTRYELNKAKERAHILEGLLKALDFIDEVIHIIRASENVAAAKEALMKRFEFSEKQAQAIVDMRLRALTGLERERLESEYKELEEKIAEYEAILADEKLLLGVIRDEIIAIRDKFGDERRTSIEADIDEITDESLIPRKDTVITYSGLGYIKRMASDQFHSQNRGGKGIRGMNVIEDDVIENIITTNTHDYIMFFTNMGRVYRKKGYEIPESGRAARGVNIINLIPLQTGEKITAIVPVEETGKDHYMIMATRKGMIKKTRFSDYDNIRKNGLIAISLREDDELIEVRQGVEEDEIFLATRRGMCIHFNLTDVRQTGRSSIGVKAIRLDPSDEVIGMQTGQDGDDLLFVTENGMGKRTRMGDFRKQSRGGKGLIAYKITRKTGNVIGMKGIFPDDEIMLITTEGIIIQIRGENISLIGRNTSGVKLMDIDAENDVHVARVTKVRLTEEENPEEETEE
ncbi:MAG: DNA gyrase subunit A [Eubacterium sp.]|nr:DNA gyrase subunit A [Eubacterium sp.]